MERVRETLNDGILYYGSQKSLLSEKKKVIGKEFVQEGKLFFSEMYARESDYYSCKTIGATLERKIKTLIPNNLRAIELTNKVVEINDQKFDIIKVDFDKTFLYFYLAKVGGAHVREE